MKETGEIPLVPVAQPTGDIADGQICALEQTTRHLRTHLLNNPGVGFLFRRKATRQGRHTGVRDFAGLIDVQPADTRAAASSISGTDTEGIQTLASGRLSDGATRRRPATGLSSLHATT